MVCPWTLGPIKVYPAGHIYQSFVFLWVITIVISTKLNVQDLQQWEQDYLSSSPLFFSFFNHIHINLSPICIHLSSLPAYKASALLCSFLWHLECYKFNVCLHFLLFSLSPSTKEVLALARINPVTSRSKLTGEFQAWVSQLDQEVKSSGEKNHQWCLCKEKQHCHPLQHDPKENLTVNN